jgi:hypothetical protein
MLRVFKKYAKINIVNKTQNIMMNRTTAFLILFAVAAISASVLTYNFYEMSAESSNFVWAKGYTELNETGQKAITVNISIDGMKDLPNEIYLKDNLILLDCLKYIQTKYPSLNLKTKDYGDMGVIVDEMAGLKNGDGGKYWQYFVNGVQPMVGADKYVLKNNDKVEWKFAKSEF